MKALYLILATFASLIFAQNDQVILVEVSGIFLYLHSANVYDENLPVTINADRQVKDEDIKYLSIASLRNATLPLTIDVLHPLIMEKYPNMQELSLSSCGMKRILGNSLGECQHLRMLVLLSNLIEEIPAGIFRNCKSLTSIMLSRNKISRIEPDSFEGVGLRTSLYLDDNQITSITPDLFMHVPPEIYALYLGSNPIQEIHPGSFPNQVQWLSLSNTEITELHPETFKNLTKLRYLYLYRNPITELPPGLFTDLESVKLMDLRHTKIRRLNSNSFGRLENLDTIEIQSSEVDEIQPGFFDNFPALNHFYGFDNFCINQTLKDPHSIDFSENQVLHQCFANWYVPREPSISDGIGRKDVCVILIILNVILIKLNNLI